MRHPISLHCACRMTHRMSHVACPRSGLSAREASVAHVGLFALRTAYAYLTLLIRDCRVPWPALCWREHGRAGVACTLWAACAVWAVPPVASLRYLRILIQHALMDMDLVSPHYILDLAEKLWRERLANQPPPRLSGPMSLSMSLGAEGSDPLHRLPCPSAPAHQPLPISPCPPNAPRGHDPTRAVAAEAADAAAAAAAAVAALAEAALAAAAVRGVGCGGCESSDAYSP